MVPPPGNLSYPGKVSHLRKVSGASGKLPGVRSDRRCPQFFTANASLGSRQPLPPPRLLLFLRPKGSPPGGGGVLHPSSQLGRHQPFFPPQDPHGPLWDEGFCTRPIERGGTQRVALSWGWPGTPQGLHGKVPNTRGGWSPPPSGFSPYYFHKEEMGVSSPSPT